MTATTNFTTVTLHLHRQIALLKQQANLLGTLVEEQFENVLRALAENDLELAEKVVEHDKEVDQRKNHSGGRVSEDHCALPTCCCGYALPDFDHQDYERS